MRKFSIYKKIFAFSSLVFINGVAFSGEYQNCAQYQGDPIQFARCNCMNGQVDTHDFSSIQAGGQVQKNPYMAQAENRQPGNPASYAGQGAANQISQTCNGMVGKQLDNAMSMASGLLGFDINALLGGVANQLGGAMCSDVNKAIASHTQLACPRVNIPGFPINCNANLNVSSSGVSIGTSGNVGGYSANGGVNSGANGVFNAGGGYNAGNAANNGSRGNYSTNGTVGGVVNNSNPGIVNTIQNNVSCWFGGTTCQ